MSRRPPVPSPAMLLASGALFLALTGGAVAGGVQLGKNSVGSGEIKNKSVKGGDLADDTVTGSQVLESSIGVVPRAASAGSATAATSAATAGTAKYADRASSAGIADRATSAGAADRATSAASADRAALADRASSAAAADRAGTSAEADHAAGADRLSGRTATDFASATQVFPVGAKLAAGESRTLVERDGVKLEARCLANQVTADSATATVLSIYVSSTTAGATFQAPRGSKNGSSPADSLGPATSETDRLVLQETTSDLPVARVPSKGIILTSAGGTSIFFGATASIRLGFGFPGALCSVSAPVVVTTL